MSDAWSRWQAFEPGPTGEMTPAPGTRLFGPGLYPQRGTSTMSLFARFVYRTLVWKERERARLVKSGRTPRPPAGGGATAPHLETGKRGENLAYWYLRRAGYTIVARNLRLSSEVGELDLVGWDGPVLAFIEIKTRTGDEAGPPEMAVSARQRRRITRAARLYLRRARRQNVTFRFDIASVGWQDDCGLCVRLIKNAYPAEEAPPGHPWP